MNLLNRPLSQESQAGIALVMLSCLTLYVLAGHDFWLLDTVNLIFHEAGHAILFFTPEFLVVLGGTLLQLAVPVTCIGYFYTRREKVAACVMLWWFGQNLLGVSRYIGDARAQVLPLLGDGHDWAYLLSHIGLLNYDTALARVVSFLAVVCMCASIVLVSRCSTPFEKCWR